MADDEIFIVCLQWSHLGQMLSYFTRWSVQKDNLAFNMQPLPIYIFCQIMLLFKFLGRGTKVQTQNLYKMVLVLTGILVV